MVNSMECSNDVHVFIWAGTPGEMPDTWLCMCGEKMHGDNECYTLDEIQEKLFPDSTIQDLRRRINPGKARP